MRYELNYIAENAAKVAAELESLVTEGNQEENYRESIINDLEKIAALAAHCNYKHQILVSLQALRRENADVR